MVHKAEVIKMSALGVVIAAIVSIVAYFIPWLPHAASEQADRIHFVYWFATVICIAIFALCMSVLLYMLWAFRASKYDESDGPHIHGNARLEVVWTVIPFVLVIALGVVSAVVVAKNNNSSNALHVKVYAQQFAWRFEYPDNGGIKSNELTVPVGRDIEFDMEAADVIHSFWVPQWSQKQDLVPGDPMELIVTPTETGDFPLICTELCGLGHATMRAAVHVVTKAEFAKWVEEKQSGDGGGDASPGASTFASAGCGGCHAFKPAGSAGGVGPALDELAAEAEKAGMPVADFVRQSIVEPDAVVAAGFQSGVMPGTYGESLDAAEIDALVQYLTGDNG